MAVRRAGAALMAATAAAWIVASGGALSPPSAHATAPLTLGITDYGAVASGGPLTRARLLEVAAAGGARVLRVTVDWAAVAPAHPPAGFQASNPADPAYDFTRVDALVRSAADAHLRPLLLLSDAPVWAEGPGAPAGTPPGSWEPDAAAFGAFAHAAAIRYSGRFPDPLSAGRRLPRVDLWEAWNEPNLWLYLSPQWVRRGRGFRAASPGIYRRLLNALFANVRSVSRSNVVVAGATAPFGDPQPGGRRIPPVTFVRDLLCLRANGRRAGGCGRLAHFDVLDHHPFDVGGPLLHAVNPGDVSVPDMGKLTRLLARARRARTVLPRRHKLVWVTELAWTSRPPDRAGVPLLRQGRWLEQGLYVLWRQGVRTALWLAMADDPPGGLAAGLLFASARAKPAATAFAFPFVVTRRDRHRAVAWGRAPAAGVLVLERRRSSGWQTVSRRRVRRFATFAIQLKLTGRALLRVRLGGLRSLTWPLAR